MPKYRTKPTEPVEVDAVQNVPGMEVPQWLVDAENRGDVKPKFGGGVDVPGPDHASAGDWIVQAADGKIAAVNADAFAATYEVV